MVIHHVFFWLKNPSSKKDLNQLFTGLRTLKGIKTVKQMHIGVPAPTENRSVVDASYQASEIIFFENVAAQKTYQDDPIHKKFIANCSKHSIVYSCKSASLQIRPIISALANIDK